MEVVVRMQGSKTSPQKAEVSSSREIPEQWETLLLGRFAMVCRDSRTSKAKAIPALIVETDEEKALWRIGQRECGAQTLASSAHGASRSQREAEGKCHDGSGQGSRQSSIL
jgi:hypothetical protein